MSLIVECDWCGSKQIDDAYHIKVSRYNVALLKTVTDIGVILLCPDCFQVFIKKGRVNKFIK